jgi:hypothetical protein
MDSPNLKRLADVLNSRPGRDPDRIPEILALIEELWSKHPDMRLGQLIVNLLDARPNPIFTVEDDILRDRLRTTLDTGVWPTQANLTDSD